MRKLNETKPGQWYIHRKPRETDVQKIAQNRNIDIERLKQEIKQAEIHHKFTEKDAKGWTSIPLRSAKGLTGTAGNSAIGIQASSDGKKFQDTYVMQSTPYIKEIIEKFAVDKKILKVRLMKLQAHSKIPMHIDKFDGKHNVIRYHLPIITNPDVIMIVNNKQYYLQPGQIYIIDVSQAHAVENNSDQDRVHLVFDLSQ